jgi:hypothetical protein
MIARRLTSLGAAVMLVALAMLGPGGPGAPAVRAVAPDGAAGAVGQVDDAVVVRITSPPPGQPVLGRVDVAGFAADPRSAGGTGVNTRDVQVWLDDFGDARNLLTYAQASLPSPAATAALGAQFGQAGWSATWDTCSFPPGPHTLLVWVSSLATPGSRNLARLDLEVAPCAAAQPLLSLDLASDPGGSLRLPGPGYLGSGVAPLFANFAVGIDARCLQAHDACRYGLEFRRLPGPGVPGTDSYYSYYVSPNQGLFVLDYIEPGDGSGRVVRLVPWTESGAIARGTSTNRLGVLADGDEIRLFVNGEVVGSVSHEGRHAGRINWSGGPGAEGTPLDIQFRNLAVATTGPREALAAVLGPSR